MPSQQFAWFHKGNQNHRPTLEEKDNTIQITAINRESIDCGSNPERSTRFRLPEKRLENIEDPIPYRDKQERYGVLDGCDFEETSALC